MAPKGCCKNIGLAVAFCMCLAVTFEFAWGDAHDVAHVADFKGAAFIHRGPDTIAVAVGTRLYHNDAIKTGPDGSIGIVFNDEATLSLGPDSELTIQDYVFNPAASEFSFVVRLFKGTAAYVSGLMARLSPTSIKFITPSASIGIRGTKFAIEVDEI